MSQPEYGAPPPDWKAPSDDEIAQAKRIAGLWWWVTAPLFFGAERVPRDRPVMFIVNHTLMGMLDTGILWLGIREQTGHRCRAMADDIHFQVPVWRDMLMKWGAVRGSRESCRTLMRQGHSLVIFPGGGREVYKRKGEAYQLLWGKRAGFARLALEHGYTLVPVASVGAEECYRILLDQNDFMKLPGARQFAAKAPRSDVVFPTVVAGLAGSMVPIPRRFYFQFGEPIESRPYPSSEDVEAAIFELREEVRFALQALLADTLEKRGQDPERSLLARLRATGRGWGLPV